MALNLGKAVVDFLTGHPDEKFTARQIAEWVFATHPEECQAKKARSKSLQTDADLLQQLVAEIGAHHRDMVRKCPGIKTTDLTLTHLGGGKLENIEIGNLTCHQLFRNYWRSLSLSRY
jgi:hypothetical protein